MKKNVLLILYIWGTLIACNHSNNSHPEEHSGINYFDQKEPGLYPEPFAPRVFSTGKEFGAVYSPDGNEIYFSMLDSTNSRWQIMTMQRVDTVWSTPKVAPFSGTYNEANPCFSHDGKRIYYCSNRHLEGEGAVGDNFDIWFVEKSGKDWGKPVNAGSAVNTSYYEDYPSIAKDGTLYFISSRPEGKGESDIYFANYSDGAYATAQNMGDSINTIYADFDPLSVDENCLIFVSDRSNGYGNEDLYISYRKGNNLWSKARNLSVNFNTDAYEYGPKISPDGKFFFFTRSSDLRKIYWTDIKALNSPAILQPVYNYIEGWYEGKGERMKLALHPRLAKRRIVSEDEIWDVTAERMYQITDDCRGCITDPDEGRKEMEILDESKDMATVKVVSNDFVDYLQLARFNERWIIVNVLWDYITTENGGSVEEIEQVVQDYMESRNSGEDEKMSELLYSAFVARRALSPTEVNHDDFSSFLEKVKNKNTYNQYIKNKSEIKILDVYKKIACVRISGRTHMEYLHLAYVGGKWKIVNSLFV